MSHERAFQLCISRLSADAARFYEPVKDLPLGAGIILENCAVPFESPEEIRFGTVLSLALVLTHECDVDETNQRAFNESVLVIPNISLEDLHDELEEKEGLGSYGGIFPQIAAGTVYRVMYLPPPPQNMGISYLPRGGFINLNEICSTPLKWFPELQTKPAFSLSAIGLRSLDYKMENHLRREKAARLWFSR